MSMDRIAWVALTALLLVSVPLAGCLGVGDVADSDTTQTSDDADQSDDGDRRDGEAPPDEDGDPPNGEAPPPDGDPEPYVGTAVINITVQGVGFGFVLTPDDRGSICVDGGCTVFERVTFDNATGLVVEMAWEPEGIWAEGFRLRLTYDDPDGNEGQVEVTGASPLKVTLDADEAVASEPVTVEAWQSTAETENLRLSAAQSQDLTLYVSKFFHQPLDADFSALAG